MMNVLWGTLNLAIGYVLVCDFGDFLIRRVSDVLVLGVGGLLMAVLLSRTFSLRYGANSSTG
jgi:hypothetical protein